LIIENLKLALASIKANKMRSFLTMLGIIIGISSVIAIMTVGNSLTKAEEESMSSMGANNIMVGVYTESDTAGETPTFKEEVMQGLVKAYGKRISAIGIDSQVGTGTARSQVSNDGKTTSVTVDGVNSGYFEANNLTTIKGSTFAKGAYENGTNVAIISDLFAEAIFGSVDKAMGQTVEINVDNNYTTYTVVGAYKFENNGSMGTKKSTMFYIPLKTAQNQLHSTDVYGFTAVAKNSDDSSALSADIMSYLQKILNPDNDEDIVIYADSLQSYIEEASKMLGQITIAIAMIAGIALLVGGIGVMNIMTVSITERTREIGTRKALGAENYQIMLQFVTEAIILCLLGGIIGVALGVSLGLLASSGLGYPGSVSMTSVLGSVGFSMAVGLFFGYAPARKAAKMNPIDALRYE
jgi:putative ABC transport system permease protein